MHSIGAWFWKSLRNMENQIYIERNKSVVLSSVLKTEINFYGWSLLCLEENSLKASLRIFDGLCDAK